MSRVPENMSVQEMMEKADQTTDESLESTRRMRQMAEESRQMGANTLATLDEQGKQLDRVEKDLDKINADMKMAEKELHQMEKCCGLCVCPWNKPKKVQENEVFSEKSKTGNVISKQPGPQKKGDKPEGAMIKRVTNDAREDEMEENLEMVGDILGDLKAQVGIASHTNNNQGSFSFKWTQRNLQA
eukprot:Colp12_sorted_trinity150504_noHs@16752